MTAEHKYFLWLYHQIGVLSDSDPNRSHQLLAEQLHRTPFRWSIPNDDNRGLDGADLRERFADEFAIDVREPWAQGPCSMLEMLISLAERMDHAASGLGLEDSAEGWFWRLLENADLAGATDAEYLDREGHTRKSVEYTLDRILSRLYRYDGDGGLFPLQDQQSDQREVEVWYQMNAYLMEKSDIWR